MVAARRVSIVPWSVETGTAEVPVRIPRGPRSRSEPCAQSRRIPPFQFVQVGLAQGDDACVRLDVRDRLKHVEAGAPRTAEVAVT